MNIDENLLNQDRGGESDVEVEDDDSGEGTAGADAGNPAAASRSQGTGSDNDQAATQSDKPAPESLREAVQSEKTKKQTEDKEKETAVSGKPNPISQGTSNLLKSAWENLIISFGATILYIDAHVFLGKIFGNEVFCKLGDEWTPAGAVVANTKEAKKTAKMLRIVEPMGAACLTLGCFIIIIAALCLVAMIVNLVTSPMSALSWLTGLFF
jgi:hypothetical protein